MVGNATAWWKAIIAPERPWDGIEAADVISKSDLALLDTAGNLIAANLGGEVLVSVESDLDNLRAACQEWLLTLTDSEEITDEIFRNTLRAQIEHLLWLIDQADLFGLSRVVRRGDEVTGALVRAAGPQGAIKNTPSVHNRIVKFAAAVTMVASLIHNTQAIAGSAQHAIPKFEGIVKGITDGKPPETDTKVPGH